MKAKLLYVATLLSLLMLVLSFSASALEIDNYNTSIDIPNGYSYITQSAIDENLQLIGEINFSRNDFEEYLRENKIILFAYNSDNKNEIIIKFDKDVWEDDFDIDLLDEEGFEKIAQTLSSGLDYEKVTLGENVFIRTNITGNDNGGDFNAVRYITVQKGNLISVEFMFSGNINAENTVFSENIISTFDTPKSTDTVKKASDGVNDVAVKCLIIAAVLVGIAVAVYVAVTLIIDLRKKRNTSDVAPYVKIKRRKF